MYRCERCCKQTETGVTCDECYKMVLGDLLSSHEWLRRRGNTRGDLPGETLADTIRRERNNLRT